MTAPTLPIEVVVTGPADIFFGGPIASAEQVLQHVADRLVAQLDLPVTVGLRIREAASGELAEREPSFRVVMASEIARVRATLDPSTNPSNGFDVMHALFDNRVLLVRDADVAHYRERASGRFDGLPDDVLMRAKRDLARLCVRTSRLDATPPDEPIDTAVDRCHDDALAIGLEHAADLAELGAGLSQLREDSGVPLPPFEARQTELPASSCIPRVNDLFLPPIGGNVAPEIAFELRQLVSAFVTCPLVEFLLASLSRSEGSLVTAVRERFAVATLRDAFRHLVDEGSSLAPLHEVLEAMLTAHGRSDTSDASLVVLGPHTGAVLPYGSTPPETPLDAAELADVARARDPRALRAELLGADASLDGPLRAVVGSASFERELLGGTAAPTAEWRADVAGRVVAALRSAPRDDGSTRVVVVSTPARRRLRECIAVELPAVRVVSWSELADDVRLEAEARIR